MKGKILLVLMVTMAPMGIYCSPAPESQPTRELLGSNYEIYSSAVSGRVYTIAAGREAGVSENLAGYPISGPGVELNEKQIEAFQSIILDEKSYIWGETKKCPFYPEYVISIEKNGESAIVLISFGCQQLGFIENDERVIQDIDPVAVELQHFINSTLLK